MINFYFFLPFSLTCEAFFQLFSGFPSLNRVHSMSLKKKKNTRRDKTQTTQADEAQEFLIKGRENQTNKPYNCFKNI